MSRRCFTEKSIERLRIPKDNPTFKWDAQTTGLGVKITPAGKRLFVLQIKRPGNAFQSKLTLGNWPSLTLAEAREKADRWRSLIGKGKDPQQVEKHQAAEERRAELLKQRQTFEAVAEAYIAGPLAKLRRGQKDAHEIRKYLIPKLGDLPIADVTRLDVVEMIKPIAKRAPYVAHICLGHIKRIYAWAIEEATYGLEHSPAAMIRPAKTIGKKQPRTRVLTDDELRAFWKATGKLGYPMGDLYKFIALTGCRRAEGGEARWPEFNLGDRKWTIPTERFKSGQVHVVPLSDAAMKVIQTLPRWNEGDHLFSTTSGAKPVNGFSKPKAQLDKQMRDQLGGELEPFTIHDLRRTVRTRLSELRVPDHVAELVIGHGRKGIQRVYDQHQYESEMREALEAWAARLREIVNGTPDGNNVVKLKRGKAS